MKDLAKLSHKALLQTATSLRQRALNLREKSSEIGERVAEVGTSLVVGGLYSYAKGRFPVAMSMYFPGTQIEVAPIAAGAVTILGIIGYAGKWSEMATVGGAACIGAELNFRAYRAGMEGAQKALASAQQNAKA